VAACAARPSSACRVREERGHDRTARGDIPAASAEPGFADRIALALDARSDAFESICAALGTLAPVAQYDLFGRLRDLCVNEPESFQALSTVIAGFGC
jgi:hypothetical protein